MAPVLEEQIEGNEILGLETVANRLRELSNLHRSHFDVDVVRKALAESLEAIQAAIRQHRERLERDTVKIRELTDELEGLRDCVERRNASMVELERSIKGRQAELEFYRSAAMGFLAAELAKSYSDLKSKTGEFTDSIRGTPENKNFVQALLMEAMALMIAEKVMKQETKK